MGAGHLAESASAAWEAVEAAAQQRLGQTCRGQATKQSDESRQDTKLAGAPTVSPPFEQCDRDR